MFYPVIVVNILYTYVIKSDIDLHLNGHDMRTHTMYKIYFEYS